MKSWLLVGIVAIALSAGPVPVSAQSELATWAEPTLGEVMPRASYRLTYYDDRAVEDQGTDLQLTQHALTLTGPLFQNSVDEWTASARVRLQVFDTRARFPETGERFPEELWDVRFGANYRHKFDNGWIAGATLTLGSASDQPFASEDELIVRAGALLRVPDGPRNAWLFSIFYANDQDILGGIPIPGIAYVYSPSEAFTAVIGVPFTSLQYRPVESVTLEATYFPPRRVLTRATYRPFRPFRVFAGFEWDNERFYLVNRGDEDDALIYYEKRFEGGARFDLRHVGFQVTGGWAFDRFYYIGESYSDRRENRLDIESGPYVMLRVDVRF